MISHTMLGTNDLIEASKFYNKIMPLMGAEQIYQSDTVCFWQFIGCETKFAITLPFNQHNASVGNGTMVALKLESKAQVDHVYSVAIQYGASCEGEPNNRDNDSFYGAYFRDLDGNKLAIFYR